VYACPNKPVNGRLAGSFEEHFGQLHYWEGYPFDFSHDYGRYPIWDQLGGTLTRQISESVVSVASFKGDVYSCMLFGDSILSSLTNA
jgi:hypothetical protein